MLIKLDDNIKARDYAYYKLLKLEDVNFKLHSDKVNNNTKFKLLKTDNYEIVDDIDDVYVLKGKLYKNYKNELFYRHMFKYGMDFLKKIHPRRTNSCIITIIT